jgi:hypothetical protein
MLFLACLMADTIGATPASGWTINFIARASDSTNRKARDLKLSPTMTTSCCSKFAAISAIQLVCGMIVTSAQTPANPQAEAIARFSDRVAAYVALQKKVEGTLPSQKQTADPAQIKTRLESLANAVRTARPNAKAGDCFDGAADQFRRIIQEDASERSVRDAFAAMQEVPTRTPPHVNADYPESAALATVPPLILNKLPRLPEGIEYRFMGRDLILRDTKANLIVDVLPGAVPTVGR